MKRHQRGIYKKRKKNFKKFTVNERREAGNLPPKFSNTEFYGTLADNHEKAEKQCSVCNFRSTKETTVQAKRPHCQPLKRVCVCKSVSSKKVSKSSYKVPKFKNCILGAGLVGC